MFLDMMENLDMEEHVFKRCKCAFKFFKKNNIKLNSIAGGWITNLEVRPEKDWEKKKEDQ